MAKRCDICGKGPRYGHTISHAHNLTNRRWNPNLQRMRVQTPGGANVSRFVRVVCAPEKYRRQS